MGYLCYVYKIVNHVDDKIYIGSTKQKLSRRMCSHRSDCKRKNNQIQKHMRGIGIEHFYIVELDRKEVEDRQQQFMLESTWQDKLKPELNINRACKDPELTKQNKKKYYQKNKETILVKNKIYRDKDPELTKQRRKEYYQKNKDTYMKYTREHKEHKDEYNKEYNLHNRDKINTKRQQRKTEALKEEKYKCEHCQKVFGTNSHLKRHIKSNFCKKDNKDNIDKEFDKDIEEDIKCHTEENEDLLSLVVNDPPIIQHIQHQKN